MAINIKKIDYNDDNNLPEPSVKFVKICERNESEEYDKEKEESFIQKTKRFLTVITVEPILAGYTMPSVLLALAAQNLYLEKACRVNLAYESHICDALVQRYTTNYTVEEEAVQLLVASVAGWKTVLQSFLPFVMLIFLGSYCDRVGQRKLCILVPIVGELITSIGLIINTYFFYELPLEVAAVTEAIFPALTGGWFTMFMGVFSYIADITTEEQRTTRMGIVTLFSLLGMPTGSALSGIIVNKLGLYGAFSISGSLYLLSIVYGYFRINEVKITNLMDKPKNCWQWLKIFFDIRCVIQILLVTFKRGPNKRRLRLIMLLIIFCVIMGPTYGEMTVKYLFTRFRFNWNEVDYSIFSTFTALTSTTGTLVSVCVFSRILKFEDALLGVIACTSKILSAFMYAFAITSWQIYIAPLIEIFNGASYVAVRSMISKIVKKDEIGKVNSLFGMADAMMPLIYAPMYTTVYTATLKTLPGTFFLLGGGFMIPAVIMFLWLFFAKKGSGNQ